jgi:CDP-glycerol glycerophosphotransferase (TagB/SpsB family)
MRRLVKLMAAVLAWPASILLRLVPTSSKYVICGAMNGNYYGDNAKYVFEYLSRQPGDCVPVWISRNPAVVQELRERQMRAYLATSLTAVWLLGRSRVAVFTNSLFDIAATPLLVPRSLRLIALRHGRSVKRVRFARTGHKISLLERLLRIHESARIAAAISTSEFISGLQEECLRIGADKHVVTGYPRNDSLDVGCSRRADRVAGGEYTVLYGPSWRHGREPTRFFPFEDFSKQSLWRFCDENNVRILLRPHANELRMFAAQRQWLAELAEHSKVELATHDRYPDVNSLLNGVDLLISDYSALYHDFLLLDRPLLLVPYDLESFERENGFLYDYGRLAPGPCVATFEEFMRELRRAAHGEDSMALERRRLRDLVHQYVDRNSTARVCTLVSALRGGNQREARSR